MSDSDDLLTMLLDQAGRLFGDLIDRDLLVSAECGTPPVALIDAVEAFGLADALTVTPEEGGLGFGEAAALFALFGHHAVPLPIGETMLARGLLVRVGIDAPEGMIGLLDGDGGPQSLSQAASMPHLVVSRGGRMLLVRTADCTVTSQASISRDPRSLVDVAGAASVAEAAWPRALPDALTHGAMLRASQIAGAIGRTLAMSVEYANTRQQFGRPIGRFQAVQQLLAKLAAEAAAARSAADTAWAALDDGVLDWSGAIAKIRTGEAARAAAAIAHQVHGAIGVTDEHFLHYLTRRLWEWRLDFGSDGAWAERLGRAVREAPAGMWDFLTVRDATRQPLSAEALA